MTVTVIGKHAHLATYLATQVNNWNFLSHDEIAQQSCLIRASEVVVNLGVHPDVYKGRVDAETNTDLHLARLLEDTDTHYVMLSSRTVYGIHNDPIVTVDTPLNLDTPYASAKGAFERCVQKVLPKERITILRQTNVMGDERNRKSTFGFFFDSLMRDGKITITHDPDSARDFMDIDAFCAVVRAVAKNPKSGIYNVGIGEPISLRQAAQAVADGYGGHVAVSPTAPSGERSYYMRSQRLRESFGVELPGAQATLKRFSAFGEQLRASL